MVSVKALAAIALTLMIAVPIVLGYGLATHEVESTQWESEKSLNLSEQILNYQTPYTNPAYTSSNNTELMQLWRFPGSGASEYHAVTPEYRETTTSNTPFQLYETNTGYYSLSGGSTHTFTAPGTGVYRIANPSYPWAEGQMPNEFITNNVDAYTLTISTSNTASYHWELDTNYRTLYIDPTVPIQFVRDGADTYTVICSERTFTKVSYWQLTTDVSATITAYQYQYTTLESTTSVPIDSIYSFETPSTGYMTIKLSGAGVGGGDAYIATNDEATPVSVNGTTVTVGSTSYTSVSSVNVAGVSQIYMTYLTATGQYADPNYGWGIPTPASASVYETWWINNYSNQSVTFLLKFTNDAEIYMMPTNEYSGLALQTYKIVSTGGMIYANDTLLGEYSSIIVKIATDSTVVSGIKEWPTMGASPTVLNTITLNGTVDYFNKVKLNVPTSEEDYVSFRVNAADVLAGYFPSTKDYTLSMGELFPNTDYSIKLNSIGVYGDTITIGSTAFGVSNGRINVDGHTVPLKGAVIKSINRDGVYENTINGYAIADTSTPASITFGGEWSLTVTGDTLKEVQTTNVEWSPGEFAFDKKDFAAVGLLVAGACFVGLGMMGQRSGLKIAALLLICGGAALVYLTFA